MAARAAGTDRHAELLSEVAPEITKRWVARNAALGGASAPSPIICRGLLSLILRATSRGGAFEALDVLNAAQQLVDENTIQPIELLGFAPTAPRVTLCAVLSDLVEAAVTQTPLLTANAALSYYSTAGAGSSDDSEYDAAQSAVADPRNSRRLFAPSLDAVRRQNVVTALRYFCAVLDRMAKMALPVFSSDGTPRADRALFWKLLYVTLPANVESLALEELRVVMGVFGAILRCEAWEDRRLAVGELRTALNVLAARKRSRALSMYARSLSLPDIRMQACLSCLLTFIDKPASAAAGALRQADVDKPMDIARFTHNLVVPLLSKRMDERAQTGVPALLTAFGEAWLREGREEQFVADAGAVSTIIARLREALDRLEAHGATVPEDVATTRLVVMMICQRVMLASKAFRRAGSSRGPQ
jgi:hypothetical protein